MQAESLRPGRAYRMIARDGGGAGEAGGRVPGLLTPQDAGGGVRQVTPDKGGAEYGPAAPGGTVARIRPREVESLGWRPGGIAAGRGSRCRATCSLDRGPGPTYSPRLASESARYGAE